MKKSLKNSNFSLFKIIVILFSVVLISFTTYYYINYKYILIRDNFYSEFNNRNFTEAKNIINDESIYLKINQKNLKKDLNNYFSSIIDKLCNAMLTNEVTKDDALVVFKEIKNYDILNSSLDKLILTLDENYTPTADADYNLLLNLGIESYNNNSFLEAIKTFNKIPDTESGYYQSALTYIDKCKEGYKNQLLKDADALASDDYYTKAIDLLSNADKSIVDYDDADITTKINELADARDAYLLSANAENNNLDTANSEEDNEATSASILQSITSENINSLYIESLTSNLIYVNLSNQTTYVYEGSSNNWTLLKEFPCSTGISSEETPSGIFTVLSRGDWFFSDSYGQGGKYWVQFLGDYLFHSLPYNEDQSEVLDYTLGTPASHGCIRLKTEDAKWIYDYILNGTKVIIS